MKFEDRFQEETERQERCARAARHGILPEIFTSSKKKDEASFYSLTDKWIMPAVSTIKPEEREFVVDSGSSVHVVSKRDLHSAELETMRISKNPTTVMTANGEVQTRPEARYMSKNWTCS